MLSALRHVLIKAILATHIAKRRCGLDQYIQRGHMISILPPYGGAIIIVFLSIQQVKGDATYMRLIFLEQLRSIIILEINSFGLKRSSHIFQTDRLH